MFVVYGTKNYQELVILLRFYKNYLVLCTGEAAAE